MLRMSYMYNLDTLPPATLLLEYARFHGRNHLQYLTLFIARIGYRKVTRKDPTGRDITTHDIRRLLKDHLHALPEYDPNRPMTRCHQDYLKATIIARFGKGDHE